MGRGGAKAIPTRREMRGPDSKAKQSARCFIKYCLCSRLRRIYPTISFNSIDLASVREPRHVSAGRAFVAREQRSEGARNSIFTGNGTAKRVDLFSEGIDLTMHTDSLILLRLWMGREAQWLIREVFRPGQREVERETKERPKWGASPAKPREPLRRT